MFAQQNKGKHQLFHLDTRCIFLKINNLTSRPNTSNIHECWETKFYRTHLNLKYLRNNIICLL